MNPDPKQTPEPESEAKIKPRPRGLDQWQDHIDKAINDAMAEGKFDNLPGHGKPLVIETNPWQPELDAGFSQLKNAGYAPTWMELDREITKRKQEMETFLSRNAQAFADLLEQAKQLAQIALEPTADPIPWWNIPAHLRTLFAPPEHQLDTSAQPLTIADLAHIRQNMLNQYLGQATELNKKIDTFHANLPRALWHLERMTVPPDRATRQFDEAIPRIQIGASHKIHATISNNVN